MTVRPYDLDAVLSELQKTGPLTSGEELARVNALVCDRLGRATPAEAFERLYTDWRALRRGSAESGLRAGQILMLLTVLQFGLPSATTRQRDELLAEARAHGPRDERWQAAVAGIAGQSVLNQPTAGPADLEQALARVEEARAQLPPDSPERDAYDLTHAHLRVLLAQYGGGEDEFDSALDDLGRLVDTPALDGMRRLEMAGQLAAFRTRQAARRDDEAGLAALIPELESVLARLPPDHMDRVTFESYLDAARGSLAVLRGRRTGVVDDPGTPDAPPVEEVRRQLAPLPAGARADKLGEAAIGRTVRGLLTRCPERVLEAVELLGDALDLIEPDDERWIRYACVLGNCHCAVAGMTGTLQQRGDHLDQGISWLVHARRLAGGPEYPLWGALGMSLAMAYRIRGDVQPPGTRAARLNHDRSRSVGLDALRAAAWSVLLQSGTAHAAETGRRAGEYALDVARWCLADDAVEDAVGALDAGRGLVLHAATVATTVPDMLTALGRSDLADEWRGTGSPAPELGEDAVLTGGPALSGPSSRLRRRVLEALAASPQRRRLLDVPSPADIGAALRALSATALVYLLPGGEGLLHDQRLPGTALMVHADGSVRALPLPGLTEDAEPLTRYRAVGAPGRDAGGPPAAPPPPEPDTAGPARAALERLCDWAGQAVMEPLLGKVPRGYGTVPAVVLVPMAELGMVPWHAARVPVRHRLRTRPGHACEQARISYVPSARLLCEVAARPGTGAGTGARAGRQALVVGNPTRDLHHAGEEAEAIHRTFHPDGELLGPGTATPAAVTGWLRRQRGGLLHLACHGVVRQGARHSTYLDLSGGRLAAEELTEGTDRYRDLDLVVLAACRTNVSGRGYDEAYSLATAFLVAGARSVVGSLWPVPDEATSLLMYMTHHYMSRDGLPPGQALRSAQLWMLDDRRQAPPGMPPRLAERVPLVRSDDLTGWAGFTHLGR
ncbi:CHAT domain-containing protein [Streptomyces sp. NRRL S-118]|uniref:CHAT domain-containing protein n=1 Tax=Streptomyces sp. NRRL S-118 TaxID=1463881 RepID=UPI0004C4D127|nr:CHAT domain-containing protein [Streptomyces sp. NRRL S-118]